MRKPPIGLVVSLAALLAMSCTSPTGTGSLKDRMLKPGTFGKVASPGASQTPGTSPSPAVTPSADASATASPDASGSPTPSATPTVSASLSPDGESAFQAGFTYTVTAFAGDESGPFTSGEGTAATLAYNQGLTGMALQNGLFFIDNSFVGGVRHVATTGAAQVSETPLTGVPNDETASFRGLVLSPDQSVLFVADAGNDRVLKIGDQSAASLVAGSGDTGATDSATASDASFNDPAGLAAAGDYLYVADSGNHAIRRIHLQTGVVSTLAGAKTEAGPAVATASLTSARFDTPLGLVASKDGTKLYVADSGNHVIRQIDLQTSEVTVLAGVPGEEGTLDGASGTATFSSPVALAVDGAGNVYVGEDGSGAARVRMVDTSKKTWTIAGNAEAGHAVGSQSEARFTNVIGLCLETNTDGSFKTLYAFDRGPASTSAGEPGPRIVKITRQAAQ